MSYGNGSEVAYTYDMFGNVASVSYDGTEVVRNYTDSAGNINRTQDLLTNLEHRVTYDSTGRLISKEVLDLSASGDGWLRSLEYNYDLNNNVTYISYADKQGSNITQYEYGLDNLPEKTILNNGKEVTYTYDTLGRLTGKVLNTTTPLNFAYTYEASDRGSGYTTTKIETETIGNTKYKYTYDNYGNISCIYKVNSDNTETLLCSYVYDSYNQLTTVNDYEHSEQTTYTYNQAGNITHRNRYQMNASWVITATLESVRYLYGDSEWKDLLTTYNGQTITYDAIGNPLSYRDGISLTWQNGRKLASYSDASNNITYTYDASGMRTGKTVTTSEGTTNSYTYVYENGLLLQMCMGSRIYDFSYDSNGTPVSIAYRTRATATPTYYYYGVNSRGDVEFLYNSSGSVVAVYKYDAYGKLNSVENASGVAITSATHIANMNPLRYRSYVYDNETGFYYLQTRYYDSVTCRFVNADKQLNTNTITGHNQFAYCVNNPTNYVDYTGEDATAILGGWTSTMWWLHLVDGPIPVGDIIYWAGVATLGTIALGSVIYSNLSSASTNTSSKPTTNTKDSDQTTAVPDTPSVPDIPDVKYPGNDPTVAPGEDYEWRGKEGEAVGGDKGAWVNDKTGERLHPDLKHELPIGPHWDYNYKGSGTKGWRLFPDGRIEPRAFANTWSIGDTIEIFQRGKL